MSEPVLRTRGLRAPFRWETDPVKGSRFLCDLAPAADEAAALAVVEAVRAAHPGASHHCFAWRLDPAGLRTRSSDDGEPGGSAGVPILRQLEGHAVTGLVAVVTRWFGGTKLGVGGLVRAYGRCAGEALDRAPIVEVRTRTRRVLAYPYECSGAVEAVLKAHEAVELAADYGAEVRLEVLLPLEHAPAFERELRDRTAARATCTQPADDTP